MLQKYEIISKKFAAFNNFNQSGYLRSEKLSYGLFKQGDLSVEIPLKSIDYSVEIANTVATVSITQIYVNYLYNSPIDIEYRFAISPSMCFHSFEAVYDDKVIVGEVKEKTQAQEQYKNLVKAGKTAGLAQFTGSSSDMITISLGNLKPKKEIKIKFSYIQTMEVFLNKFLKLLIPSTLSQRYDNRKLNLNQKEEEPLSFIESSNPSAYPWTININISSNSEIEFMKSSSHLVSIEYSDERRKAFVSLDKSITWLPNKDFTLLWRHTQVNIPSCLLSENLLDAKMPYCAMLTFFPDFGNISLDDAFQAEIDKVK